MRRLQRSWAQIPSDPPNLNKLASESLFVYWRQFFLDNKLEKVFKPSQTRSTIVWGLILIAFIDVPLLSFFFLGSPGPDVRASVRQPS